jgi:colanic acid/amylovoran biosynthesis glycosyltransferase
MTNNKYIIKTLSPWMIDELLAFSEITNFTIVFLRKQDDFYLESLRLLESKGIEVYFKPASANKLLLKIWISLKFLFNNFSKFDFRYNGVIGIKSIYWFCKLDVSKFTQKSKIHAQFATQASIVSLLIKLYYNNRCEYSFTFHAYDIYFPNKWFKLLVDNCKNAFSISDYNINFVKEKFHESSKIILSRLGVFIPKKNIAMSNFNTADKFFILGLMSWFVEKKGIDYLLKAMLMLKKEGYNEIKLMIAGDGPLKERYSTFVQKNNLNDSVELIGKFKGEQKRDFYNSIDAFILPSITLKNDQDGIPVVLMEAISYGLPIISTNISGIPEICINNFNGILIKEKDVNAIKQSILILKNTELRKKYALNSLKVSREYDIDENSVSKIKALGW